MADSINKTFEIKITADSPDDIRAEGWIKPDLKRPNDYIVRDVYYEGEDGKIIRLESSSKPDKRTLQLLVCQIFKEQLANLPDGERFDIPMCQDHTSKSSCTGIFRGPDEFKSVKGYKGKDLTEYSGEEQFVMYRPWNIFSPIVFARWCLKEFKDQGHFVLKYRKKFSSIFDKSGNLILRGAPGTGKTYLAKNIAAGIITESNTEEYDELELEQKEQVEFVQFHPGYDYSDFVEGLRPKVNGDGTMIFKLRLC